MKADFNFLARKSHRLDQTLPELPADDRSIVHSSQVVDFLHFSVPAYHPDDFLDKTELRCFGTASREHSISLLPVVFCGSGIQGFELPLVHR